MKILVIEDDLNDYDEIGKLLKDLAPQNNCIYIPDNNVRPGYLPYDDGTKEFSDKEQLERIKTTLEDHWESVSIFIIDMVLNKEQDRRPPLSLEAVNAFLYGDNSLPERVEQLKSKQKAILFITKKTDFIIYLTGDNALWKKEIYVATYKPSEGKFDKGENCSYRDCPRFKDNRSMRCSNTDCFKSVFCRTASNVVLDGSASQYYIFRWTAYDKHEYEYRIY